MTTTNWWNPSSFATSEGTFNTARVPQNISAYFRRPAKILKPNSRNESPRTSGRRRMTTHLPARTRSVVDAQRPSMNARQHMYRNAASSRPMSWHPNFVNEFEQYQTPDQQFYPQGANFPTTTTFEHGLVTPSSYPVGETYLDCPNVPLEQMAGQDFSFFQNDQQAPYTYPYMCDGTSPGYMQTSTVPYQATGFDTLHMAWPPVPPSFPQNLATAPTSPDFLPMPDFGQSFDVAQMEEAVEKDELVGMGLYDSPAQVQSASLLFNGPLPVRRKSLKLEESFEPAPPSDSEDDDAESEPTLQDTSVSTYQYQAFPNGPGLDQGPTTVAQYLDPRPSYSHIPQEALFAAGYPDQQGMLNGAAYSWF